MHSDIANTANDDDVVVFATSDEQDISLKRKDSQGQHNAEADFENDMSVTVLRQTSAERLQTPSSTNREESNGNSILKSVKAVLNWLTPNSKSAASIEADDRTEAGSNDDIEGENQSDNLNEEQDNSENVESQIDLPQVLQQYTHSVTTEVQTSEHVESGASEVASPRLRSYDIPENVEPCDNLNHARFV